MNKSRATPHTWIEAAAGAFFQNTPFYPVGEMLKQALAWRGDEPAEQQFSATGVRAGSWRDSSRPKLSRCLLRS